MTFWEFLKMIGPKTLAVVGASLILAGGAGFLTATAVSSNDPVRTVTVDVGKGVPGPAGPRGPQGPPGPAGKFECPTGFSPAHLVINAPGGQVTLYTCLKD